MSTWRLGLGDDEFVGYTFEGVPERRPRLWFLDRQIEILFLNGPYRTARRLRQTGTETGIWELEPVEGLVYMRGLVRYEHCGGEPWTAVWRLTDVTIPHVWTFGHDDTWRLGVWPD